MSQEFGEGISRVWVHEFGCVVWCRLGGWRVEDVSGERERQGRLVTLPVILKILTQNAEQLLGNNRSEATPPNTLNTTFDYSSRLMLYTTFDNNSGSMYLYVANSTSQTLLIQIVYQISEHV